jgi:hypothetical protein
MFSSSTFFSSFLLLHNKSILFSSQASCVELEFKSSTILYAQSIDQVILKTYVHALSSPLTIVNLLFLYVINTGLE